MAAPTPFARGREADVYALDGDRVLRRYRDGGDVTVEAGFLAHLHESGFPVPRVYHAAGADLVMRRVSGPTMRAALVAGSVAIDPAAELLAGLHRRLHTVAALPGAGHGARILHLDLHPDNVILDPQGAVVIDWRNARHGPPGLDVAMTALILAQVAVDPHQPLAAAAEELLRGYLRAIRGHAVPLVDEVVAIRRANPTQTPAELARLPTAAALVTAALVTAAR
ncbi:serine/threonine protein kinase [Micromonospora zingiberis]|uniref:Serine/threonine protein kinase n=1 Tax=Micromonospora zingiberis TaxID=2053011 RepID=A0A4R0GRI7_9ACTN|nr:phosphotransferase [Micromonospora zingiberis]TCC00221.1 serine/threonine protein kinase [Micromonospora zingiberis]